MPAAGPNLSHVVGFDDFPFTPGRRANVPVVGVFYAGLRLEGILSGAVRQDGANATGTLDRLVSESRFAARIQLVMLQGIALGGFNVVDIHALRESLGLPVLVVARREPNFERIREALLNSVPGGRRKWRLIERAGPMEPVSGVWVQRAGISLEDAAAVIERLAVHGRIPEPLRVAHLIAGGMATGQSQGRA